MTPAIDDANVTGALVEQLFALMRNTSFYGMTHAQTEKAAAALALVIREAMPPFSLQFVADGIFRDRTLVPVDVKRFKKVGGVTTALRNLSADELSFDDVPSHDELLRLGFALAQGTKGRCNTLEGFDFSAVRWREIPEARWGEHAQEVDSAEYSLTQIALGVADMERILEHEGPAWPFPLGIAVIRRLERAVATDAATAGRALEMAPGAWTPPRRAVSAAFHALAVLDQIGCLRSTARTTAHAVLTLAATGFACRWGKAIEEAANVAMERVIAAPVLGFSGISPHRLQVCTILHALSEPDKGEPGQLAVLELVTMCYETELFRCPRDLSDD
ncbi:hypothetical protein ACFL59_09630, partial [Planctomycetota bacterium]